jgi:pimeloyl-ACP methyl ester carboxylesterase
VLKNKNLFIQTAVPGLFIDSILFKKEIDDLIKEALNINKHAISYASLAMRNRQNFKKLVTDYDKDFLIIQGGLDSVVPPSIMLDEIFGLNVEFKLLKDCGHMCHIESSESVLGILSDFLVDSKKS